MNSYFRCICICRLTSCVSCRIQNQYGKRRQGNGTRQCLADTIPLKLMCGILLFTAQCTGRAARSGLYVNRWSSYDPKVNSRAVTLQVYLWSYFFEIAPKLCGISKFTPRFKKDGGQLCHEACSAPYSLPPLGLPWLPQHNPHQYGRHGVDIETHIMIGCTCKHGLDLMTTFVLNFVIDV